MPDESAEWTEDYLQGKDKWRYVVVKPGQTIYFESGTVRRFLHL